MVSSNDIQIFISSACLKKTKIVDAVNELARAGFQNIELSGGTQYYEGFDDDLRALKKKYHLNYLLHNYFPPPQEPFVLNLASLDDETYHKSIAQVERAIELTVEFGGKRYGMHAGTFLSHIHPRELGLKLESRKLNNTHVATARFCEAYRRLQDGSFGVGLYVENNVLSHVNHQTHSEGNPLMLTSADDYFQLKDRIRFKLLLDVAHLKVSSMSQGLNFEEQIAKLMPESDYIHISDNDGKQDTNRPFLEESELFDSLRMLNWKGKTITLEVCGTCDDIHRSYETVQKLAD